MPEKSLKKRFSAKEKPHTLTLSLVAAVCFVGTIVACAQAPEPTRTLETATPNTPTATLPALVSNLPPATATRISPTETLTPIPAATPLSPRTPFDNLISPFANSIPNVRADPSRSYPERAQCINPDQNRNRIDFAFFGRGETYEPPALTKPGTIIGSFTIISYDQASGHHDEISISHDFHSPRIAQAVYGSNTVMNPNTRISQAFDYGGFPLMRQTLECATGLPIDFAVVIPDSEIAAIVDLVGGIDLQLAIDTQLYSYFIDGQLQPPLTFTKDKPIHLNGKQSVGAIKAVPNEPDGYNPMREHHVRAQAVRDAVIKAFLRKAVTDLGLKDKLLAHIDSRINGSGGQISYDFDPKMIRSGIEKFSKTLPGFLLRPQDISVPTFRTQMYVADERSSSISGPGKKCFGVRPTGDMFAPSGADTTEANPAKYWQPLRNCIQGSLRTAQNTK